MPHTPAPWHILTRGKNWQNSKEHTRDIAAAQRPGDVWGRVAIVHGNDLAEREIEMNARLIAAAPELLEFAKAFVQCFSKDGQFNSISADYGTEELHEMARGAIRKATKGSAA